MGEMLVDAIPHQGGRPKKRSLEEDRFSLAEIGVTKNQSSRYQALAEIPELAFSGAIEDHRSSDEPLTAKLLLRAFRAGQKVEANEVIRRSGVVASAGQHGTIVIDPPWDMQKIERDVRPNQVAFDYPTMSEDELAGFDVAGMAATDCHLFCWTTQKFLPSSLRLVEEWGFRYCLTMVWHKPGGFQPVGLPQYNCEFVVYARKGSPSFLETKAFPCAFHALRREHSRKPDEFYDLIRRVAPEPRIDVFSREARDGFAQFGNETAKFGDAA
jgi:N6-adenosine-specific RNA methylase IME4